MASKAPLTIQNASLKTASVEIQAIVVSGKQMTMGVFRQLQSSALINPDTLEYNGTPWGLVNYFWGDCRDDHFHVVFQKGNELRRSCVYASMPWSKTGDQDREVTQFFGKTINDIARLWAWITFHNRSSELGDGKNIHVQTQRGYHTTIAFSYLELARLNDKIDSQMVWIDKRRELASAIIWPTGEPSDDIVTIETLLEKAIDEYLVVGGRIQKRRDRWTELYHQIEILDQLFIAV